MPIYEYECAACRGQFEEMQKITASPLKTCRLCGTGRVRRLISQTSFQLKGTGWYQTDYARKPNGKDSSDADASKASSGSEKSKNLKGSSSQASAA